MLLLTTTTTALTTTTVPLKTWTWRAAFFCADENNNNSTTALHHSQLLIAISINNNNNNNKTTTALHHDRLISIRERKVRKLMLFYPSDTASVSADLRVVVVVSTRRKESVFRRLRWLRSIKSNFGHFKSLVRHGKNIFLSQYCDSPHRSKISK